MDLKVNPIDSVSQLRRTLVLQRSKCFMGIVKRMPEILCVRVEGVQGVLTLFCSGVAQTCHDDRVVELKEQLVVEEVDGERQEGKVKEGGRGRVKENAPCG